MKMRSKHGGAKWKFGGAVLALAILVKTAGIVIGHPQQAPTPSAPAAGSSDTAKADANSAQIKPPTIRSTVELVNVPFTALNKRGMPVIDMNQSEFQVFEDGVEQTITHFERETSTPLRVGLIIDTSNSARPKMASEKEAASQFIFVVLRNGGTKNQAFLQTFDATSSIVQDFTNDPEMLNEKVQDLKAGGGKALYDAVYSACRDKMRTSGPPEEVRRILIVFTDGLDVQSQHTLDQTISMARRMETMIYTVGTATYGYTNAGDKLLEDLAEQTGGYASFPMRETPGTDLESGYLSHGQIGETSQNKGLGVETGKYSAERLMNLATALDAIGRNLDEQYLISYRPMRATLDGTYRTIKVVTGHHGVTLRWKPGYFASATE